MKKLKKILIILTLLIAVFVMREYYTTTNSYMIIKPIDKELNEGFLTGKGLYSNLFTTTGVIQYYTIKNYDTADFIPKIELQFVIVHRIFIDQELNAVCLMH